MDRIGVPDLWQGREAIQSDDYTTDLITDSAVAFIRKNRENSFFLFVAHAAPHFPFQGPDDREKLVQPKKRSWQLGDRNTYIKMVEHLDRGIGNILAELDQLKLKDKTLVVFTSDNGGDIHARNAPFSGHKSSMEEGGIRVPCIARWPGKIPAQTVSIPTITMDWSATIRRIAGYEADPAREDGIDLMPLLTEQRMAGERSLFWRRKSGPAERSPTPAGRFDMEIGNTSRRRMAPVKDSFLTSRLIRKRVKIWSEKTKVSRPHFPKNSTGGKNQSAFKCGGPKVLN